MCTGRKEGTGSKSDACVKGCGTRVVMLTAFQFKTDPFMGIHAHRGRTFARRVVGYSILLVRQSAG